MVSVRNTNDRQINNCRIWFDGTRRERGRVSFSGNRRRSSPSLRAPKADGSLAGWNVRTVCSPSPRVRLELTCEDDARFLGHATAIEHWIARRGLPSICELVRSQPDAVSRQQLLHSLVAHRTAVQAILEADGFDELSDLVAREKDELQRSRLLVLWLAHSAHWIDGGRVDRVLNLASLQGSAVNRRDALFQIVDSRPAVAKVNEGGHLNQLLTLCRLEVDPTTRRDLLLRLLESQLALGRLARTDDVVATLRGFLEDTRRDFPDSWLDFLLVRFALLSDLIDRDHFGEVLRAIDAENDPAAQWRLNLLLLRAPHAILELVDRGRHRDLARLMADEIRESSSPELLDGLLASRAVVQAMVAGGGLEPLFERIEREDRRVSSVSLLVHLLTIPAAREQWFEAGYFDRVCELVETRWDAAMRKRFIQRLLDDELGQAALHRRELALWVLELCRHEGDGQIAPWAALLLLGKSRVRQHMVTHGQGELLHEAVRQLSDGAQRKQLLRALVYSPSGMIAHYVERGQFEEAEQLLDQYAHDDWGRQRLAASWWIGGRIDQRIETMRPRFETSADQGDGRQLAGSAGRDAPLGESIRLATIASLPPADSLEQQGDPAAASADRAAGADGSLSAIGRRPRWLSANHAASRRDRCRRTRRPGPAVVLRGSPVAERLP
jgi:hypothetical protein